MMAWHWMRVLVVPPALQWWDSSLQWWVYNGCTVKFLRIVYDYSCILEIFELLGFRQFVLALIITQVYHADQEHIHWY